MSILKILTGYMLLHIFRYITMERYVRVLERIITVHTGKRWSNMYYYYGLSGEKYVIINGHVLSWWGRLIKRSDSYKEYATKLV
jgi:hypothetical protein